MRKSYAVALASLTTLVGFADVVRASATIDLIWADTGNDTIYSARSSSEITLQVILTAGPAGSQGAGVSVDYGSVSDLSVLGYMSTPGGPLPLSLGTTTDTGTRVENVNSASLPPYLGTGLTAGQSHQLGTVMFHVGFLGNFSFEISSDVDGPTDDVLDLDGSVISSTTTFNSAFIWAPFPDYCEIDKKCSVNGSDPQDSCIAASGDEVTYSYDFVGGTALIFDDKLGEIGVYAGQTLTRTVTLTETTTNTAYFEPLEAVCLNGIFSDRVTVTIGSPTPTATPTATPTPTPVPSPLPCAAVWPVTQIVTIGKGQNAASNRNVSHVIWGHIIDPGAISETAHRIEVCAGTQIDARVFDSGAPRVSSIRGSDGLECYPDSGCSGVIDVNETYKVISADRRDRDSITFIPR